MWSEIKFIFFERFDPPRMGQSAKKAKANQLARMSFNLRILSIVSCFLIPAQWLISYSHSESYMGLDALAKFGFGNIVVFLSAVILIYVVFRLSDEAWEVAVDLYNKIDDSEKLKREN